MKEAIGRSRALVMRCFTYRWVAGVGLKEKEIYVLTIRLGKRVVTGVNSGPGPILGRIAKEQNGILYSQAMVLSSTKDSTFWASWYETAVARRLLQRVVANGILFLILGSRRKGQVWIGGLEGSNYPRFPRGFSKGETKLLLERLLQLWNPIPLKKWLGVLVTQKLGHSCGRFQHI